jgi:hypothetical protein
MDIGQRVVQNGWVMIYAFAAFLVGLGIIGVWCAVKTLIKAGREDRPKRELDMILELDDEQGARFLATKKLVIERTSPIRIRILVLLPGSKNAARECTELERIAQL